MWHIKHRRWWSPLLSDHKGIANALFSQQTCQIAPSLCHVSMKNQAHLKRQLLRFSKYTGPINCLHYLLMMNLNSAHEGLWTWLSRVWTASHSPPYSWTSAIPSCQHMLWCICWVLPSGIVHGQCGNWVTEQRVRLDIGPYGCVTKIWHKDKHRTSPEPKKMEAINIMKQQRGCECIKENVRDKRESKRVTKRQSLLKKRWITILWPQLL